MFSLQPSVFLQMRGRIVEDDFSPVLTKWGHIWSDIIWLKNFKEGRKEGGREEITFYSLYNLSTWLRLSLVMGVALRDWYLNLTIKLYLNFSWLKQAFGSNKMWLFPIRAISSPQLTSRCQGTQLSLGPSCDHGGEGPSTHAACWVSLGSLRDSWSVSVWLWVWCHAGRHVMVGVGVRSTLCRPGH